MGRREVQAAETRRTIVAAARRLFAADGYARTSMSRIAQEAGVSVQTIYDAVGGKADVAAALNDLIDEEAGIAALARTLPELSDPRELVALPTRITRQVVERCGDLLRVCEAVATSEPQLAQVLTEGRKRHRRGNEAVAARLESLGALRVPAQEAAETLSVLSESRFALMCVEDYGMSLGAWERWVNDVMGASVLKD